MSEQSRRLLRKLTFWLYPNFVFRCLQRFQTVAGFDRSIALASLMFTAVIPLAIVIGAIFPGANMGNRIVQQLGLQGASADAVLSLFNSDGSVEGGFSIFSLFLLVIAVLSFARAVQRAFEACWELPPLSVRNTFNGLRWIGGLTVYFVSIGAIRSASIGTAVDALLSLAVLLAAIGFFVWSGVVLTNRRVQPAQMLPGAILTALSLGIYGVASDVWVPQVFQSSVNHYGTIGVTFALISWIFGAMVCLVASTALGRETSDEFASIRRGEHPSTKEIDAEWAQVRERVEKAQIQFRQLVANLRARRAARHRD